MSELRDRRDLFGPLWVYLLALTLFFLRFGYGFALGDQDEFIPLIFHRLDPSLLANDWFVGTQLDFSVRSLFVALLLPFARAFPIADVALWSYLVLWFAVAVGSFRLLQAFGIDRVAAAGAVLVSLGVLHKWTLGSNDLVYTMLVPEMVAWALALPAVTSFVNGSVKSRFLWPLLLGLAAWYQVLVGLLVFGCLFVTLLWNTARTKSETRSWQPPLVSLAVFAVASLPVSIPILLSQMEPPTIAEGPSIFYILAPFRNPIHHMLLSFPTKSVIRFAMIVVASAGSLWWLQRQERVRHGTVLARIGVLILAGCVVMFLCTEVVPVLFVAKLQLYKLTVLFKLLAMGLLAAVVVAKLPRRWMSTADFYLEPGKARLAVTACLVVVLSIGWITAPTSVERKIMLEGHLASDLGKMERWIDANTERDAVFAIPPSNSTFRSNARRAIVVNFVAFPYSDPEMAEWFRRIQAVAPVGEPETGLFIRPKLDDAFERLPSDDLRGLARTYNVDYVLRQAPLDGFEKVNTVGNWTLYRIG